MPKHTQTSPSHSTLRQGRCSILALCTTGPFCYVNTCDTFLVGTNHPFPSPQEGVTVCHFTRQYLFVPSLDLSAMVSLTCRPIFALWTWAMSSDKYWVNHGSGMSRQPQTWLHCLKSEPLPLLPARHKHTHTQSSTPVVACQWSRQTCRSRSVNHGSSQCFDLPETRRSKQAPPILCTQCFP